MNTPRIVRLCLPAFLLAGLPAGARAEPPALTAIFPPGTQRGSTAEVTVEGKFKDWPVAAWADRPGVEFRAGEKRGTFQVAVAADAVPGVCWVRLHNDEGASDVRPFLIGALPEVSEREPNDDPGRAHALETAGVTVNGRLARRGEVDVFALTLRKGQTLVASMQANEGLGSPMDGVLQVLSAEGFVLEQNDDHRGLDPQVVFTAPADGRYLVRTFAFPAEPDSNIGFAGGPNYVYRLTLTAGAFADHAFPLAVPASAPGKVGLVGWNVPEGAEAEVVADEGGEGGTAFHPLLANPARVRLEPHATAVEKEGPGPQAVQVPVTLTGRVARPEEMDVYTFALKKGESVAVRLEATALGSPLDPVVRLTDSAGKAVEPPRREERGRGRGRGRRRPAVTPDLSVTAPADGTYRVEVSDLHGRGGLRFVYLLRLAAPAADFALTVAKDTHTLAPGKPLEIAVTVERRNGFGGDIEITAEGLPGGVTARPVTASGRGDSVNLTLEAAGPAAGSFRIVGKAKEGPAGGRAARVPIPNFSGTTEHLWLTATGPKK